MNCPSCKSAETRTSDSRAIGAIVRRCRRCEACQSEWATTERVDEGSLQVATGSYGSLAVATPAQKGEGGSSGTASPLVLIPDQSGPSQTIRKDRGSNEPLPADFVSFWAAYPLRTGKAAALRAWRRHRPPLAKCLETLKWQRDTVEWTTPTKEGRSTVPHPATWINAGRWEDERPAAIVKRRASETSW